MTAATAATPTRDPIDRTAPCARCATAVGGKRGRRRVSGVRFGLAGILCRRCYNRLNEAAANAKKAALRPVTTRDEDWKPAAENRAPVIVARPPAARKVEADRPSVFRSPRYLAVRDAKRLKWALGMTTDLTLAELDAVLPRGSGEGGCDV